MKLTIRANLEDIPAGAQFEIEIPGKYAEITSKSAKILLVVAEAVERVRKDLTGAKEC